MEEKKREFPSITNALLLKNFMQISQKHEQNVAAAIIQKCTNNKKSLFSTNLAGCFSPMKKDCAFDEKCFINDMQSPFHFINTHYNCCENDQMK